MPGGYRARSSSATRQATRSARAGGRSSPSAHCFRSGHSTEAGHPAQDGRNAPGGVNFRWSSQAT